MPSVAVTPAAYALTWGAVSAVPVRVSVSPARLSLVGGTATMTQGIDNPDVTTPELNRAQRQVPIGEIRGGMVYLTAQEQLRQQRVAEGIEAAFTALSQQTTRNTGLIAQIQAAMALAQVANDNATATKAQVDIANSYTDPIGILEATSDGAIEIEAHERVYGDRTTVPVNGGSLSGYLPGDYVTVYYQDASHSGGAVEYLATTSPVAQIGATHIAGQVRIPSPGQPPATGAGPIAPGFTLPPDVSDYGGGYQDTARG